MPRIHRSALRGGLLVGALALAACTSAEKTAYAIAGGALFGAQATGSEIEQVYYLGVFDPLEQVQPTLYRLRVRGQASMLSNVKFASGWVAAPLIDSLGTKLSFNDDTGALEIEKNDSSLIDGLPIGRKLMLFGPEGTRPAPAGHRLVLLMGSNPDAVFQGMDRALAAIAEVGVDQRNLELNQLLLEATVELRADERQVESFQDRLKQTLPTEKS